MPVTPVRLSELGATVQPRRAFLARASALSLVIPGLGASLAGCADDSGPAKDAKASPGEVDATQDSLRLHNSNSRLDTAVVKDAHGNTSVVPGSSPSSDARFRRYDPVLPPLSAERTLRLQWRALEAPVRISADTVVAGWTFEGDIPGPIVHCCVGDTVEFTLTNESVVPHSMDFHAAQIDPKVAFRSVTKGQSVSFTFKPRWAGAFMYHCGTAPVLMHIGSGMYGACLRLHKDALDAARLHGVQRSPEPVHQ
jgi:nitrite reductase (NO-forming)